MVNKSDTLQDLEEMVENTGFQDIPEWLTEELFLDFLRKDLPEYEKITKFIVKPAVTTGENYMTVMLRVAFEVQMSDSSKQSTSYMVKIKPTPEGLQALIKEWKIFNKERTTYTKYIPKFEEYYQNIGEQVRFAPGILMPQRLEINDDLLILEDLLLRGFRNANRHEGLDIVHTKAVLKKLAQFHAASARYAQYEEEFPAIYDQCLPCEKDEFRDYRINTGEIFRDHLHDYGDFQHLQEKLKTYSEIHVDPFQMKSTKNPEEFQVLNHGDLWVNNIMFQYNKDGSLNETYFIDFQLSRYSSPAQDLIYFLLSSTTLDIKVKLFDYFISYYHKHLIKNLELINYKGKIPKLKEIHMSLLRHDYWAYTTVVVLLPIVISKPRDDANVHNLLGKDGDAFRRFMFGNQNLAENMRVLLPFLDNRGAFDL